MSRAGIGWLIGIVPWITITIALVNSQAEGDGKSALAWQVYAGTLAD